MTKKTIKQIQLTLMREDSETAHHVVVNAVDLTEALTVLRRDYPQLKDYAYESYKVLEDPTATKESISHPLKLHIKKI